MNTTMNYKFLCDPNSTSITHTHTHTHFCFTFSNGTLHLFAHSFDSDSSPHVLCNQISMLLDLYTHSWSYDDHKLSDTWKRMVMGCYGGNGLTPCFFSLHVVLPLTISSFFFSPFVCSRWVKLNGLWFNDPFPSRIGDEWPFRPMFLLQWGSQRDSTTSELPHSLLYSSVMSESWCFSKNSSGIVWKYDFL